VDTITAITHDVAPYGVIDDKSGDAVGEIEPGRDVDADEDGSSR
jgi:hypothetical protein